MILGKQAVGDVPSTHSWPAKPFIPCRAGCRLVFWLCRTSPRGVAVSLAFHYGSQVSELNWCKPLWATVTASEQHGCNVPVCWVKWFLIADLEARLRFAFSGLGCELSQAQSGCPKPGDAIRILPRETALGCFVSYSSSQFHPPFLLL